MTPTNVVPTIVEESQAGPPDRMTLRAIKRFLDESPRVLQTEFEPNRCEPRLVRAQLDTNSRDPTHSPSELTVHWAETGEFSIRYVETSPNGDQWKCRWEKHRNTQTAEVHFHRPPNADDIEAVSMRTIHPLDVVQTALTAVCRQR